MKYINIFWEVKQCEKKKVKSNSDLDFRNCSGGSLPILNGLYNATNCKLSGMGR